MPRPLAALLEEKLGTKATPFNNPLNVASIGVTAVRILPSNPNRFAWIFIDLSPNLMYLLDSNLVSAVNGIQVGASGGNVVAIWEEDFELVSHEWWAVAGGAASAFIVISIESAGA